MQKNDRYKRRYRRPRIGHKSHNKTSKRNIARRVKTHIRDKNHFADKGPITQQAIKDLKAEHGTILLDVRTRYIIYMQQHATSCKQIHVNTASS